MKKTTTLLLLILSFSGFCTTDTTGVKEFKITPFFSPERLTNITRDNFSKGRDYISFSEGSGYGITKSYFNYTTGINLQFPLTKKLSMGTGIAYTQQDLEANHYCMWCGSLPSEPEKLELRFIEVPLFIQYNLLNSKIKVYVQAGAQGTQLLRIPDLWFPNNISYNRQTFKGILGIGTSIDLGKHFAVQLTPTYRYAFNSVYKETELKMHSIGITGGISYRIKM